MTGEELRRLRISHGLTLREAANLVAVAPSTVWSWESGAYVTKRKARTLAVILERLPERPLRVQRMVRGFIGTRPEPDTQRLERRRRAIDALIARDAAYGHRSFHEGAC